MLPAWLRPVLRARLVQGGIPALIVAALATTSSLQGLPLERLGLELVIDGLERPTGIAAPGDLSGRLFVLEKAGRIRLIENGRLVEAPLLDLQSGIASRGEQGLLGLAFHPDFASNGLFYANYTDLEGDTIVAEYGVDASGDVIAMSERRLLHIDQPHLLHNGGGMAFGPDGYLYIGVGDGGWPDDQVGTGQDVDRLLGTILRVDVDGREGDLEYAIPSDNPFADGGGRPEIWDHGLRNPWRFAFDPATGDLYIADVGHLSFEEVNVHRSGEPGGKNFGWSIMEGSRCFRAATCDRNGLEPPLIEYRGRGFGTGNCAIIGGPVLRQSAIGALEGSFLFGDHCSGRIWSLQVDPPRAVPRLELDSDLRITAFGTGDDGSVYLADLAGAIWRLTGGR